MHLERERPLTWSRKNFCRSAIPRMRSRREKDHVARPIYYPFERVVGRFDKVFCRAKTRLSGVASRPIRPQDSPLEDETPDFYFTNRVRWSGQTDISETDRDRRRRSSNLGKYLRPFDQALQNCQKTFVVVQKLHQLLTDLLKLDSEPLASGCHTNNNDSRSTVVSDILECELLRDLDRGHILTGPSRIRQMKRISMWKCDVIKDELRSLQITSICNKYQKVNAERLFTKRWGRNPVQEFRNIDMTYPTPFKLDHINIEQLLNGVITEDSVECVMEYLPTLLCEFRQFQTAYRSEEGKTADYGLDTEATVDMIDNHHKSHVIRAKTARRCTSNIETVRAALNDLLEEASNEFSHRKKRARQPSTPGHRRSHSTHLYAVSATLQWIVCHLSKAEDGAKRLATPKLSKTGELIRKPCSERKAQLIHDWGSLSDNGFGGLVTFSLAEVVERLVRKPLSEDEVTAQDPILENIPHYLRPKWKCAY
ncbi:hypothetical protein MMC18_009373 [Xylographa bjoerkii]|nr:hypothetical protein [Xylographa bjoerkii]